MRLSVRALLDSSKSKNAPEIGMGKQQRPHCHGYRKAHAKVDGIDWFDLGDVKSPQILDYVHGLSPL